MSIQTIKTYLYKIPILKECLVFIKKHLKYQLGLCQKYAAPTWKTEQNKRGRIKFAVICDNLTWENINREADAVYLTAKNWREQMESERPDIFFCESAWQGIDKSWEGQIYKNHEFCYDNRWVLKDILKYCKNAGIKTIFWNKENSPAFYDKPYSFIDTALLFEHIFTTTSECIEKYKSMGHKSVHLMMFGYSPEIFKVKKPRPDNNTAVFLGSWYDVFPERCKDMCEIFDMIIDKGFTLKIYDRLSYSNQIDRIYPEKYRKYILPAVTYEQTADVMNDAAYVININTVKNSKTMFARRVFEAMACGRIVISNHSIGMKDIFKDGVWYQNEPFDRVNEQDFIQKNLQIVREKYTFKVQLALALCESGINLDIKNL